MVGGPQLIDVLNSEGKYGSLTVGTTAVEVKADTETLNGRQAIVMQAMDNEIYWGYDSSVTTSTGTRIFKHQLVMLPIGWEVHVYVVANGSGKILRFQEIA